MGDLNELFARLDGAHLPGGCSECEAVQEVGPPNADYPNVHVVTVLHEENCPALKRMQDEP